MSEGRVQRRLAAILAADVAGYSRLVREDEEATLSAVGSDIREIFAPSISNHNGRLFKTMGDGLLAEFPSVVDAVRCAVDVQRAMKARNQERAEDRRIAFRIGVNLGDVVADGDDLQGDGVNVAARLEGLAEPGGIWISGSTYEQVRDRLDMGFHDEGERQVRNIDRPVHAIRVVIDGKGAAERRSRKIGDRRQILKYAALVVVVILAIGSVIKMRWASEVEPGETLAVQKPELEEAPRLSIVVLPFTDLSADPAQDYFAEAITEDLITDLSRIRGAFVIARSTSLMYKDKAVNAKDVARELNVRYVLEGSARREGDTVRVNSQLIDGESGIHLWSEKFDRRIDDIIALQSDITGHIASVLRAELIEAESRKPKPANLEAWDYAVRGTVKIHRPSLGPQVYEEAKELFDKAIDLDPSLAMAWEGLSFIHFVASTRELPGISGPDSVKLSLEAAERAVLLDPKSSGAHVALGLAARASGMGPRAISSCETALEINPNNDEAYLCASRAYYVAGRLEESIEMVEIAERLNPRFRPWRRDFYIGASRYFLGEYDAAVAALQSAKADFPKHQSLTFHLVAALAMANQDAAARAMLDEYFGLVGNDRNSIEEIRMTHEKLVPDFALLAEGLRRAGMPDN